MKEVTIEVRRKANERSGYQMSQAHFGITGGYA
jgi:hypothetical protein